MFIFVSGFFIRHVDFWDSSIHPCCCKISLFLFPIEHILLYGHTPNSFIHSPLFLVWSWIYVSRKDGDIRIESLGQIHPLFRPKSFRCLSPDTNPNQQADTSASHGSSLFLHCSHLCGISNLHLTLPLGIPEIANCRILSTIVEDLCVFLETVILKPD